VTQPPTISVVVPTYRRQAQLARCLEALAATHYPPDRLEVIVVDDGSGASPAEVIERASDRLPVKLHQAPHRGPGAARNAGAGLADGELLAFTDDDCLPEPDWLPGLAARHRADPSALIGGRTENALPDNVFSSASQLLVTYLYEYYADPRRRARRFFTTNNLALSRPLFHELGAFDDRTPAHTAEDRDLCARASHRGVAMVYAPEAVVRHAHALDARSFWRQHHLYGRSALYVERVRARRAGENIRLEPFSFYLGMLTYPFRGASRARARLSLLLAATQAAYAHGVARQLVTDLIARTQEGENGAGSR
jgi:GT2 family glycosyltransferase